MYKLFALALLGLGSAAAAQQPTLVIGVDTMDQYAKRADGPVQRSGSYYIRRITGSAAVGWTVEYEHHDSTGAWTATQRVRTQPHSLRSAHEQVRSRSDSASLLVTGERAVGWVVPAGGGLRLIDGILPEAAIHGDIATLAFAASRPDPGSSNVTTTYGLYAANPLAPQPDTMRAQRREQVQDAQRTITTLVAQRRGGQLVWIDADGRVVARRGNAGPALTWWHVRRGVNVPGA